MWEISFWELLLLLVIVFLILARRDDRSYWWRLARELETRLPVFSAETTRSAEAEFIRDRLPERVPKWLIALAALGMLGALVWWWLG